MLRSPGAASAVTATDTDFLLEDDADPTKILRFQLSGFTTGVTRTFVPPNADGTLALASGHETRKLHNRCERVILSQGVDRPISAGDVVRTPLSSSTDEGQFSFLYGAVIPDGEVTNDGVTVVAS